MVTRILSFDQIIDGLISSRRPHFSNYLAMYSSWYGGIIIDPPLMLIPLDDHIVHRGDGVFEVVKCTNWNIYALDRHLDRLELATSAFELKVPADRSRLVEIIRSTVRAGNSGNCVVRLFVSRGPGGFSANPYESLEAQLYVIATALQPPPPEQYERGVSLVSTSIPIKTGRFATMKSCNYMQNVLMKKEASDAGADYPVSFDEYGFIAEGATENIGIVTRGGEFLIPCFKRVLRGITVARVSELAQTLLGRELTAVAQVDITREQALASAEILVFGTGLDILPVVRYDGQTIGDGQPGPIYRKLLELFRQDQASNSEMLTKI